MGRYVIRHKMTPYTERNASERSRMLTPECLTTYECRNVLEAFSAGVVIPFPNRISTGC
jgi:hypothetical protein